MNERDRIMKGKARITVEVDLDPQTRIDWEWLRDHIINEKTGWGKKVSRVALEFRGKDGRYSLDDMETFVRD